MSLQRLVAKYIGSTEQAFDEIEVVEIPIMLDFDDVCKVVDSAKAYLEDAKYYRERQKFEVSLTSVAYCEGLLDALRILGAVKFEWYAKRKSKRRRK